jgi:hypothetical protein
LLYQATHAAVIASTSASRCNGPVRNGESARMHSVLYSPIVVSARALSRASRTLPTEPISPASCRVWPNRIAVYWVDSTMTGFVVAVVGALGERRARDPADAPRGEGPVPRHVGLGTDPIQRKDPARISTGTPLHRRQFRRPCHGGTGNPPGRRRAPPRSTCARPAA